MLVRPDVQVERPLNLLRTVDPYAAMTAAMVKLHGYRRHPLVGPFVKAHMSPAR